MANFQFNKGAMWNSDLRHFQFAIFLEITVALKSDSSIAYGFETVSSLSSNWSGIQYNIDNISNFAS